MNVVVTFHAMICSGALELFSLLIIALLLCIQMNVTV